MRFRLCIGPALFSLVLAGAVPGSASAGLIVSVNAGSNLTGEAAALAAFNRAASRWETYFSDDITVNIAADLRDSTFFGSSNIIGSASSVLVPQTFDTYRNAMIADSAAEPDDGIVSALPDAAGASFTIPGTASRSGNLLASKANAKALGFTGLDITYGSTDATITFNSDFSFDYDNSDGVGSGLTDFETVAAHEIGHALGFISAVDFLDQNLNLNVSPTLLDLFRFEEGTANDPEALAEFTSFNRTLMPGTEANFDELDNEWRFSTGAINGDGRQASHWKDNNLTGNFIGMMDPTLSPGQRFPIRLADVRALDLIGYNINFTPVPEPGQMLAAFFGLLAILVRKRLRLPVARSGEIEPSAEGRGHDPRRQRHARLP